MKINFTLLIILVTNSAIFAQLPGRSSTFLSQNPSSLGVDEAKLVKAITFAQENEYSGSADLRIATHEAFKSEPFHEISGPTKKRGGPAGIILKGGRQIASWGDTKRVDMTFSVTKSYLSTLAGLALEEGLIKSLDEKVSDYVWDGKFEGKHNSKITWRHLLTQSSDWSGDLWGAADWADRPPKEGEIDDWKNRSYTEPGINFEYNDVRVNLLAYALLQVWRKPLPQVLKEKIMDPIGASSTWRWYGYDNSWVNIDGQMMQSVSGGGHSGGGIFINTEDHARFGQLFLNQGDWNEKQLFDKNWIAQIKVSSAANPNYGFMWWLNKDEKSNMKSLSSNAYYAAGFGGNYIFIEPSYDMVIVARWLEPSKADEFVRLVHEALK